MLRMTLVLALALPLSACGGGSGFLGSGLGVVRDRDVTFDGVRFRGKARAVERSDPALFTASARPASASLDGARQAAEFKGVRHCLRFYGTSDIDWETGPDTDPALLVIEDDSVVFQGTCRTR